MQVGVGRKQSPRGPYKISRGAAGRQASSRTVVWTFLAVLGIPCGHLDSSVHPQERPEAGNRLGGPDALTEQTKPGSTCVLGVSMSSSGLAHCSQPGLGLNPNAVAYEPRVSQSP